MSELYDTTALFKKSSNPLLMKRWSSVNVPADYRLSTCGEEHPELCKVAYRSAVILSRMKHGVEDGGQIADFELRIANLKKHRAWGMEHGVKDKKKETSFSQSTERIALMKLTADG